MLLLLLFDDDPNREFVIDVDEADKDDEDDVIDDEGD